MVVAREINTGLTDQFQDPDVRVAGFASPLYGPECHTWDPFQGEP